LGVLALFNSALILAEKLAKVKTCFCRFRGTIFVIISALKNLNW
jgi:hypothetical protein